MQAEGASSRTPEQFGEWEPIQYRFHYLPVQMALLHTGRVLAFGGSGNDRRYLDAPRPAEIWDPRSGEVTVLDQSLGGDVFCTRHSFLPNGHLLVAGGTHAYDGRFKLLGGGFPPFGGLKHTYPLRPRKRVLDTWARRAPRAGISPWSRSAMDGWSARWTPLAEMSCDRLYHSNAPLLPAGRGMAAGSNPSPGVYDRRIELYHPPHLYRSPGPSIDHAPYKVSYGEVFKFEFWNVPEIEEVALIRPTSTTHCLNTNQRYVGLPIENQSAGRLAASMPANRNLAPPGYCMLYILRDGIPSVATVLQVQ